MGLSKAGIEALGFTPMAAGDTIEAEFYSVHIYEVQGISLSADSVLTRNFEVGGVSYKIGIGISINTLFQALTGDDFTDDEAEWTREHKRQPPYAIVHMGPTVIHSCSEPFVKMDGPVILTYDAFSPAQAELRSFHERALPSIETGLSCAAKSGGHPTKFVRIDRALFGRTPENVTVIDIRVDMTGVGYAARRVDEEWVDSFINDAGALAADISPKVSRLFQLALVDEDPLKRFLYFFLALEIETHRVYGSIDHARRLEGHLELPERIRAPALVLLTTHPAGLRSLFDRFVWCAVCAWNHVDEADIEEFGRLKKIRDAIAHGAVAVPPAEAVGAIEDLTAKIVT